LLGTTYGGNGQTTFALPDLRSRSQIHQGGGHTLGEAAGAEAVTLSIQQLPTHFHNNLANPNANNAFTGGSANATLPSPIGNFWANSGKSGYTTSPSNALMGPGTVSSVGGNQAHNNQSPFLTLTFCIALIGIFPSQN
jgi:microcystin-dependent protein